MRLVRAPSEERGGFPSLFLAGGIAQCPDWQSEVVRLLSSSRWTVYNPRRERWSGGAEELAQQIRWESDRLSSADAILFWFPGRALCPMSLFELGAWSAGSKPLIVGIHDAYPKKREIVLQLERARPGTVIVETLEALAERAWLLEQSLTVR